MTIEYITRLAHEVPERYAIKELERAIQLHKEYDNEETKRSLLLYCMMFISGDMSRRNGIDRTINELKGLKALDDRLNGFKN
jgi:hypothetical protein